MYDVKNLLIGVKVSGHRFGVHHDLKLFLLKKFKRFIFVCISSQIVKMLIKLHRKDEIGLLLIWFWEGDNKQVLST